MKAIVEQQQMELHQAQIQYAAYSAYGVRINSLSFPDRFIRPTMCSPYATPT